MSEILKILTMTMILASSALAYDDYSENCDIPKWFDMSGPGEQCNPDDPEECFGFYYYSSVEEMKENMILDVLEDAFGEKPTKTGN